MQRGGGVRAEELVHRRRAAACRHVAQRAQQGDEQAPARLLVLQGLQWTKNRSNAGKSELWNEVGHAMQTNRMPPALGKTNPPARKFWQPSASSSTWSTADTMWVSIGGTTPRCTMRFRCASCEAAAGWVEGSSASACSSALRCTEQGKRCVCMQRRIPGAPRRSQQQCTTMRWAPTGARQGSKGLQHSSRQAPVM